MGKYIRIAFQVIILYLFSLVGSLIVQILPFNFPGSIMGLLILLGCLYAKIIPVNLIKDGAGLLLGLLALFFVPATVGVMNYPEFLSFNGMLLVFTIIVSTILAIIVSGRVCQYIEGKESKEESVS
ncbi:CidA/LrgA family protein [Psychrobacillus sp. FSL H8-0483]|uniref:CidA/LrgA family protein n=1 Tax=Psychrobacillus sp. FSL H8-0483 TaxID=2921389 RepID=UPI003159CD26